MKFMIRLVILLIVLGIIFLWMKTVIVWQRQVVTADIREDHRRTSITLDSFLHVQQLRKKRLRQFCRRFPQLRSVKASDSAEHLLSTVTISHKLRTLYCKPPDVSIDGWEELIQDLERRSEVTLRNVLPIGDNSSSIPDRMVNYNSATLARVLRTYTKVLFVGDPLERLVSIYMQGHSGEVSFEEFIEDILMMETRDDGGSTSSVLHLCYPCFVRYDHIVLLDFLQAEASHVLRRIGVSEAVELPPPIDRQMKVTSRWLSQKLFQALDKELLQQITELYSWDFTAFPLRNQLFGNRTLSENVKLS
ncbi:carbohydrate sulfotransferase 11-like isoform X1 [Engystomops pustulosus]|uniref:carbohydrate sulfotransferase 11-like isoform X1 n=1 Tax=Engystomops pustulosus TaxID=76066 RepID=UPI003AFA9B19